MEDFFFFSVFITIILFFFILAELLTDERVRKDPTSAILMVVLSLIPLMNIFVLGFAIVHYYEIAVQHLKEKL